MAGSHLNLPNTITVGRIAACPAILLLALAPTFGSQIAAFVLFLAAAFSDLWDGYVARKHGLVTDVGKLLDPLADKLLLASTFVPFYIISHRPGPAGMIPWWTVLPLWVMIVVLGREVVVTLFRQWAVRREVVIAAGASGKYKTLVQNLFSGGLLFWYPIQSMARDVGWNSVPWRAFTAVHATWIGLTLSMAIILTVYSMIDYFWSYRALIGVRD